MSITIDNGLSGISVGDDGCDFKLISYSGFAAADYDVKAAARGASDGGYISAARIGTRTLGIKFDFGGGNAESVRQSLISFFAPGRSLTVTVKRGGMTHTELCVKNASPNVRKSMKTGLFRSR